MRWWALRSARQSDARWRALGVTLAAIAAGGALFASVSGDRLSGWRFWTSGSPAGSRESAADRVRLEIHQRFQQGVVMLHARQYDHAMAAFHRVLALDPEMPEAHVNMGFALIGLERHAAARDFFESAIALRTGQANAYYGLAVTLEGMSDRPGAIGAMRTFVHLSKPDDPYLRKAHAALWEWESAGKGAGAAKNRARVPAAGN